MRNLWIRRLAGGTGFVAALALALAGTESVAKDSVAEAASAGLTEADIAALVKMVEKKPDDATVPTIKGAAMMLALYAQMNSDGKDAEKMLTLRANALKVAELSKKKASAKDYEALKKAVDDLKAFKTPEKMDKKELKIHAMYDFDVNEAMAPFRNSPRGFNSEKDLKGLTKKVTDKDAKLAAQIGARSAYVAEFALLLPPTEATKADKKKKWDEWSKEMGKLGADVAEEASKAKVDTKALQKKLSALEANCTACHNVFK